MYLGGVFVCINPLALRVLSLYPFMGTPRKATGHGRGRGGCPNPFPLLRVFLNPSAPPLSHVRAQGRRLIPFCFPILPSLRVPSSYILFGDIYSIGLRETVREEFPLCRIILENEMEIVFTLLPCVVLAV